MYIVYIRALIYDNICSLFLKSWHKESAAATEASFIILAFNKVEQTKQRMNGAPVSPQTLPQAGREHSSRGEQHRSEAVNNPKGVVEGGPTEQPIEYLTSVWKLALLS